MPRDDHSRTAGKAWSNPLSALTSHTQQCGAKYNRQLGAEATRGEGTTRRRVRTSLAGLVFGAAFYAISAMALSPVRILGVVAAWAAILASFCEAQHPQPTSPSDVVSAEEETEPPPCHTEHGFRRPGTSTYKLVFTDTARACCCMCGNDTSCRSWNRDRRTGACGLKSDVPDLVSDANFDSGVVGGAIISDAVPLVFPCPFQRGVNRAGSNVYPGGNRTESEEACCRLCEDDLQCVAWAWRVKSGRCFLKNGLPPRGRHPDYISGTLL